MTNKLMQWGTIFIELFGLLLITVEIYFPKTSESLKALFEETKPKIIKNSHLWIGSYIFIWVLTAIGLSVWDQSNNYKVNVFFTLITILVLLVLSISKTLVRLGVVLGRGNSVGGVGLMLALIGFSIAVIQFT